MKAILAALIAVCSQTVIANEYEWRQLYCSNNSQEDTVTFGRIHGLYFYGKKNFGIHLSAQEKYENQKLLVTGVPFSGQPAPEMNLLFILDYRTMKGVLEVTTLRAEGPLNEKHELSCGLFDIP